MKKKQRKSYTTAFKVKIALEAIKGQRTINEIATHYGVHPNMVTEEALKAELYQQIGQLKVELDWLKKKSGMLD
jgi:putative transposase